MHMAMAMMGMLPQMGVAHAISILYIYLQAQRFVKNELFYFAKLIFRCRTTLLRLSKELRVLVSLLWPSYSARTW